MGWQDAPLVDEQATGLREAGNIDLHKRPIVKNADGTISTVHSMSFGSDQGEVLIPQISDDGSVLDEKEAIDLYRKTGKHLGIFDTPQNATAYAQRLHNDQDREYSRPRWEDAPLVEDVPTSTSAGEKIKRQGGLALRSVLEGPADLLSMPTDAVFGLVNFVQAKRGKPMPFKLASESIHDAYTEAGLPEAESQTERIVGDVQKSLTGAGAGVLAAGRQLVSAGSRVAERIGETLLTRTDLQALGNAGGTASASTAREKGSGTGTQIAAGIVGGMVGGGAGSTAGGTKRAVGAAIDAFTEGGRRAIAGRALNTAASNAERAAANLDTAQPLVPGSTPTTGQTARDAGLAFFENRLRALGDKKFADRISGQNEARQTLLDTVADGGLPERIQTRISRRETQTTTLRDRAFTQAQGKAVETQKILDDVDALLANPDNAGESVQKALKAVRGQIEGKTDARALYAVRKEINRILEGRYVGSDESVLRYAGSQLKAVRDSIDTNITTVAPSWKAYLTKYAQLSKPIERAETLQEIRQKTSLAAPDVETGRDYISQPKWRNVVTQNLPELERTMTKGQIQKLRQISADLDRGAAAANAANLKLPGSDTAANLATSGQISVAHIVSKALGTPVKNLPPQIGTVMRPLSFVYKLPDESIREMLVDAMLDPQLASQLMREGTVDNVRAFTTSLAEHAQASGIGVTASQVTSD